MAKVRLVSLWVGVALAQGCSCRAPTLTKNLGELVVVTGHTGAETLERDATLTVPDVAMADTGQSEVVLRNVGRAALTIVEQKIGGDTSLALSGVLGETIEPGGELRGTITFSPTQDPDASKWSVPQQAVFYLSLTGTSADESLATITVKANALGRDCYVPSTIDFGLASVGLRFVAPLRLVNGAQTASTTTFAPVGGDDPAFFGIDVDHLDVAPQSSVDAPLWFAPTAERTYRATMLVQRGVTCAPVTVTLTGQGVKTALSWAPASLDFGKVPLGLQSKEQSVSVINSSGVPLHVSGLSTGAGDFIMTRTPTFVGGRSAESFSVRCQPTALGRRTGELTFSLDTQPATDVRVPLSCQGGGPRIQVASLLAMGTSQLMVVGDSMVRRLPVSNVGTPPPATGDVSNNLMFGFSGKPPFVSVVPTNSSTLAQDFEITVPSSYDPAKGLPAIVGSNTIDLEVHFKPNSLGSKAATLFIYSNDGVTPVATVALSANAVANDECSSLLVSPTAVAFGDLPRGATAERTVSVTNYGSSPCLVSAVELTPGSSSAFSLANLSREYSVAPNSSLAITVRARVPKEAQQGSTMHGNVRLYAGRLSGPLLVPVELKVSSCLTLSPTNLAFGAVGTSCRSAELSVALYNSCGLPVLVKSIAVDSGPFVLTQAPTIPEGGLELTTTPKLAGVAFLPTGPGPAHGNLLVKISEAGVDRDELVPLNALGTETSDVVDNFVQGAGALDILFVVDDSCSMADEQTALGQNFHSFIQHAQGFGADFHLGVTTTDVFSVNGALRGFPSYLTQNTTNLEREFFDRATVGTTGSGFEQPLEALIRAVTSPQSTSTNLGFLRDDVPLAAVIVTDAIDQSPLPVSTYLARLRAVKGNRSDLLSINVVGPFSSPSPTCQLDSSSDDGRYAEMLSASNGAKGDICTSDWAHSLDDLGKAVAALNTRFVVSSSPESTGSLSVTVDGQSVSTYSYDPQTRTVVFKTPPPPTAKITVAYHTACFAR